MSDNPYPPARLIPDKFGEANTTFAEGQDEYSTLKGYREEGDQYGTAVFKWKLSFRQRLAVLFTGAIWHGVLTFNKPLQPISLSVDKADIIRSTVKPTLGETLGRWIVGKPKNLSDGQK